MIKPVNNHIIIEPLKHDSFVPTTKGTYEEVGVVIEIPENWVKEVDKKIIGKKVYFDSWLASRYPKNDKEYFWLVDFKDVKAIDYGDEISK